MKLYTKLYIIGVFLFFISGMSLLYAYLYNFSDIIPIVLGFSAMGSICFCYSIKFECGDNVGEIEKSV